MVENDVVFRIYLAGQLPNSQRAMSNLTAFCRRYFANRHQIEVVDVFQSPERALADNVLLTPTLVIATPLPPRTIVGDLSDVAILLQVLHGDVDQEEARRAPGPQP